MTRPHDSTVARIAGNIASGMAEDIYHSRYEMVARLAVMTARAIVAEVVRTEPQPEEPT